MFQKDGLGECDETEKSELRTASLRGNNGTPDVVVGFLHVGFGALVEFRVGPTSASGRAADSHSSRSVQPDWTDGRIAEPRYALDSLVCPFRMKLAQLKQDTCA